MELLLDERPHAELHNNSEDNDGKTKITNTVIAPLGHKVSETWQFDANNHWRSCTVCNAVLAETQMAHEMNGEKCTTCSYDSTAAVTAPDNEPETTPTDAAPAPTGSQTSEPGNDGIPWWGYGVIILGGITAGIGIAFILIKRKKNS